MAEGLFAALLPEVHFSSAGVSALVGHGADPIAVQIMADAGIDISAHRGRVLTDAIARDADLILVMDEQQKQLLSEQYPYVRGKVFKLGEAAGVDIPDPYMQNFEHFQSVFFMIENGVDSWMKRINSIA